MRSCVVCKKKTPDEELNGFQECTSEKCYGTFMNNLRKGMGPMFPAPKKKVNKYKKSGKKGGQSKGGSKEWRTGYSTVKKENLATPPTMEEEQSLAEKV